MTKMKRHEQLIDKYKTLAVVVDYQEKMVAAMPDKHETSAQMKRLLEGLTILGVPILATEQYPAGLGPTVSEVKQYLEEDKIAEKMTFSCCGIDAFEEMLDNAKRGQVILMGVECHVCVLQTALDLIANGYQVFVPLETTCSRNEIHRDNALERMKNAGTIVTNVESVLFELMYEAGTEDFKKVRKLIV